MCNPIKTLTRKEWTLWLGSLAAVIISNIICNHFMAFLLLGQTIYGAEKNGILPVENKS